MDLMKELLEDDYMQYQMNQKLGPNALNRQTQADRAKQQTQPEKAQQPTDMGTQNGDVPGDNQGALQGGGDVQAANQSAKQAVKLLRQSAQALAPAKFEGDTAKAMEYLLGRITDYFANKQL